MRIRDLLSIAVVCTIGAGCYNYEPVESPSPGDEIRARLTADAAVWRSEGLLDPILHYDGTVVDATTDTLVLDVLVARSSSAFQDVEIRDTVRLGKSELQSMQGRRISVVKSVLVTVAAGVAAFAVITGIDQVVGGTTDDDDDGEPGLRVPIPGLKGLRLQVIIGRSP
jgi:hypothetical protein